MLLWAYPKLQEVKDAASWQCKLILARAVVVLPHSDFPHDPLFISPLLCWQGPCLAKHHGIRVFKKIKKQNKIKQTNKQTKNTGVNRERVVFFSFSFQTQGNMESEEVQCSRCKQSPGVRDQLKELEDKAQSRPDWTVSLYWRSNSLKK